MKNSSDSIQPNWEDKRFHSFPKGIYPVSGHPTLTGTAIPSKREAGSNGNEGVTPHPQNFKTGVSPPNVFNVPFAGRFIPSVLDTVSVF